MLGGEYAYWLLVWVLVSYVFGLSKRLKSQPFGVLSLGLPPPAGLLGKHIQNSLSVAFHLHACELKRCHLPDSEALRVELPATLSYALYYTTPDALPHGYGTCRGNIERVYFPNHWYGKHQVRDLQ